MVERNIRRVGSPPSEHLIGVVVDPETGRTSIPPLSCTALDALCGGDNDLWSTLHDATRTRLEAVARKSGVSPDDVGDVCNTAFERYFEHLVKARKECGLTGKNGKYLRLGENVPAYLAAIVRNTAINNHRKDERRKTVPYDPNSYRFDIPTRLPDQFNTWVDSVDQKKRVRDVLGSLSPKSQEAVYRVIIQGLSYEEAAKALGVPLGTVASRVNRAREKLRELLEEV